MVDLTIEKEAAQAVPIPDDLKGTGLVWASDEAPGLTRRRQGKGFSYRTPDGAAVRDAATLARIRSLAIPPAWTQVWISLDPNSHLQATGRDARGRKQYRYHPSFSLHREIVKFEHLVEFGEVLPLIRRQTLKDLRRPGLPREKVLACVVRLLETTLIRIGNEDYARENKSFGLTTLRNRHVAVEGSAIRFEFKGKSGKLWKLRVTDKRIARVLRTCQDLPGQRLFQYLDEDGTRETIASNDVNAYLKAITGRAVTAKDFRTWAGTVQAALALSDAPYPDSRTAVRRAMKAVIDAVAARLGNTPTVCRRSYVHPEVLTAFEEGGLVLAVKAQAELDDSAAERDELEAYERAVLDFLHQRMDRAKAQAHDVDVARRRAARHPETIA